jgi:hypothetical protein
MKDCCKWKLGYTAYMKGLDNGRGNLSLVIDLETGSPSNTNGGIASRPRGHKTTETDLKHAASARALIV